MSIKIMSMVSERYPTGGGERLLAFVLAAYAPSDGTRIFPSISFLARKTKLSLEAVKHYLQKMERDGWLLRSDVNPAEYRINPAWMNGGEIHCSANLEK